MRKRACNNIDALKKQFFIAMILLTGLFILPKTMVAQDTVATTYWLISFKKQSYKLGLNTVIDTIIINKKQQKESVCITYKNEDASSDMAGKKTIILMTTTRQEIGRYEVVNNTVSIPFANIIATKSTEHVITINVVQQPSNNLLAKRARIGTKLLCYLKW